MTRGDQRDRDRAKALKRAGGKPQTAKDKDGLSAAQRQERDANILREKQQKKAAEKAALAEAAHKEAFAAAAQKK